MDNHNIPSILEKTSTVNSVFGDRKNKRNKIDLKEYNPVSKFFLEKLSPKYPYIKVPIILNKPIRAKAHPATQAGKNWSSKNAGKCVETKTIWNPQTKKPSVKRLKFLFDNASFSASVIVCFESILVCWLFFEKLKK